MLLQDVALTKAAAIDRPPAALAEVAQCQYLLVAWFVDDAEPFGSNTLGELAQPEVFRQAYSWVENYWFVYNTKI